MNIRKATSSDITSILALLEAKAEFDISMRGFNGKITATEEKLKSTLFGNFPFAHVLLIELSNEIVGIAFYHYRYSSFSAEPSVWLDDLFVLNQFRSNGLGEKLMYKLQDEAKIIGASHISWTASPQNQKVQQFYEGIGARIEKTVEGRPFYHWLVGA